MIVLAGCGYGVHSVSMGHREELLRIKMHSTGPLPVKKIGNPRRGCSAVFRRTEFCATEFCVIFGCKPKPLLKCFLPCTNLALGSWTVPTIKDEQYLPLWLRLGLGREPAPLLPGFCLIAELKRERQRTGLASVAFLSSLPVCQKTENRSLPPAGAPCPVSSSKRSKAGLNPVPPCRGGAVTQ